MEAYTTEATPTPTQFPLSVVIRKIGGLTMMLGRNNLLNIFENTNKPDGDKIVLAAAKELAKKKGAHFGEIIQCELLEESIKQTGGGLLLNELQILETINRLVEKGKLTRVEDSGLIRLKVRKQKVAFYEKQQRLQQAYLSTAGDVNPIWNQIVKDENNELQAHAKIITTEIDYSTGGRGRSKKKNKRRMMMQQRQQKRRLAQE